MAAGGVAGWAARLRRTRARRERVDPWKERGWGTRGFGARVAGGAAGAFALFFVLAVALAAEEWQFAAYENERYVVATGVARDDDGEVLVSAPRIGTYRFDKVLLWDAPSDGETVRVLLNPRDPRDYLDWSERARPWPPTVLAALFLAGAGACLTAVAVVVRRGSLRPDPVLDAAAPPMEPDVPASVEVPARLAVVPPPMGLGYLVAAVAGLAVVLAFPTGITKPVYLTAEGRVAPDFEGRLTVSYYNEHTRSYPTRALTSVEAQRLREGDRYVLEYAFDPDDDQFYANPPNLLLGVGWVGFLAARRLRWTRALRRLPRRRAKAVPLVGWTRVHGGRTWLAVAPYGSTRVSDVVLVPLDHMAPAPDAVRSILWVRGPLRGGAVALVHTRAGVALWPAGPARGATTAAILGPSPWAPEPPPAAGQRGV